MDLVIELPQSADWRGNSYNSILVIVNWLTKMVHYELVQMTIAASALAEVIVNVVVLHHGLPNFNVSDRGSVFMSKF